MISRLKARWKTAGWNEFVLFASIAAVCVGVWLFIHIASVVAHETHLETETRFMQALRNPDNLHEPAGPLWLIEIGRDVSALGGAVVVISLSLLVIIYLGMRRQWGRVALIVVTVAGGYALSNTLKMSFDRERPDIVPHLSQVHSASFPSGHSMLSSLVYLTMGALLAQASDRRREKIYFVSVAFFLTFMIGLSRVFLGVHYPTDVLAGWSAGTAWAVTCWLVASRFRPTPQAG
ncbi:MAG: phosphatase PAP2 family protein [Rariglobus sp.]